MWQTCSVSSNYQHNCIVNLSLWPYLQHQSTKVCRVRMASSTSKQLREYLQEQQKPFVLDVYLSERQIMLNKKQKRPCGYDLNKRRIMQARKILKLLLLKFTRSGQNQSVSSCQKAQKHEPVLKTVGKPQQIGEMKWLPKVGSSVADREYFRCNVKDPPCYENHASLHPKTSQALTHSSVKQKVQKWMLSRKGDRNLISFS